MCYKHCISCTVAVQMYMFTFTTAPECSYSFMLRSTSPVFNTSISSLTLSALWLLPCSKIFVAHWNTAEHFLGISWQSHHCITLLQHFASHKTKITISFVFWSLFFSAPGRHKSENLKCPWSFTPLFMFLILFLVHFAVKSIYVSIFPFKVCLHAGYVSAHLFVTKVT